MNAPLPLSVHGAEQAGQFRRQDTGRLSGALGRIGVNTSLAAEWTWVLGRVGVASTAAVGALFYLPDTSAYTPILALAAFALVYNAGLSAALLRKHVMGVFLVGFVLDNLVILGGWWIAARELAGSSQTNDLYLILFPLLVSGVMRLGWMPGVLYTALWLSWMALTETRYFPSDSYMVQQLPLRLLFMAVTAVIAFRLVSRLASESQRVESLLHEVQKQSEELAERNLQLEAVDGIRQTLLSTIVDHLKAPVAHVKAAALNLQAEGPGNSRGATDGPHQDLSNAVQELETLVQDALEYSTIQSDHAGMEPRTADVVEICQGALQRVRPLLLAKGQLLDVDLPQSAPAVLVSPQRCEHVLRNLLSHASACTGSGETIALKVSIASAYVVASVADKGPKLQAGEREDVFLPFYRKQTSHGREKDERGLGLALAKRIAEVHHGRLWVESNGDRGNVFFFAMPRADRTGANEGPDSERPGSGGRVAS
ncbi:MAG: HAMP domain-containing histidine kinase [Chloroflexi bacterium]|nr:HAMP domain-containing histidine kinase [Chloroflexota bacterium]